MGRGKEILRYRFLFNGALVAASIAAGMFGGQLLAGFFLLLVGASVVLTWVTYKHNLLQPRSETLRGVLESEVLPRLHQKCNQAHPNEIPDLRVNVMFLRRRGVNPWRQDFHILPWQKTLQIEAAYIGPTAQEYGPEKELEWTTDQGVVGDAMNEQAQEAWTRPGYADIDPRIHWNLSQTQYERTNHINSVLSVPIYLPSDEEKSNPVGVVNLDSTAPPEVSRMHDDDLDIREEAIYWSNVIGAIVE